MPFIDHSTVVPNCRSLTERSAEIWTGIHATNRLVRGLSYRSTQILRRDHHSHTGRRNMFRVSPLVVALAATTMLTSAALAAEQTGKSSINFLA
jgi:hypothetical protein